MRLLRDFYRRYLQWRLGVVRNRIDGAYDHLDWAMAANDDYTEEVLRDCIDEDKVRADYYERKIEDLNY